MSSIARWKFRVVHRSNIFCGTRIGQIYHARLRTPSSSLNQRLFSKNIVNNPSGGAIEYTQHFRLVCNRYNILEENCMTPYHLSANRHSTCYFLEIQNSQMIEIKDKTLYITTPYS